MSENTSSSSSQFINPNTKQPEMDRLHLSLRTENQLTEIVKSETAKAMERCGQILISDLRQQVTENELFSLSTPAMEEMVAWILSPDPACPLDDQSQMRLRAFITMKTAVESFRDIYNKRCKMKTRKKKSESTPQTEPAAVAENPASTSETSLTTADLSGLMNPVPEDSGCVVHEAPPTVGHELPA
jgi:hypothetical protein